MHSSELIYGENKICIMEINKIFKQMFLKFTKYYYHRNVNHYY